MEERTTVRLPRDLLDRARRKAAAEGRTLTSLIADGLRMALAEGRRSVRTRRRLPPISTATGGLLPGILPDVNVLIGAFRADHPQHSVCRPWLVEIVSRDARFGLSTIVLSAVEKKAVSTFQNPPPPGGGGTRSVTEGAGGGAS